MKTTTLETAAIGIAASYCPLPRLAPCIRENRDSEIDAPPLSKELKKRWSYFIRKVYETDPLYSRDSGQRRCQTSARIELISPTSQLYLHLTVASSNSITGRLLSLTLVQEAK